jgi:hypothetical protein
LVVVDLIPSTSKLAVLHLHASLLAGLFVVLVVSCNLCSAVPLMVFSYCGEFAAAVAAVNIVAMVVVAVGCSWHGAGCWSD